MKAKFMVMLFMVAMGLVSGMVPSAEAAGGPTLSYVRFNRYGTNIYATYCMTADWYQISWTEIAPNPWPQSLTRRYGAINHCETKHFYTEVVGNETLQIWFNPQISEAGHVYSFRLYPTGGQNMTCSLRHADSFLQWDDRLNSATACAYRNW